MMPLSFHQIQISWQPPETLNGILTGYEVTVYNIRISYRQFVSVSPSILNITISDYFGNEYIESSHTITCVEGLQNILGIVTSA